MANSTPRSDLRMEEAALLWLILQYEGLNYTYERKARGKP